MPTSKILRNLIILSQKHETSFQDNQNNNNPVKHTISKHQNAKMTKLLKKAIFDLETSGLGQRCDILQMALVDLAGKTKPWSQYMQPTQGIDPGASRVNKLTVVNDNLCYNGVRCKNVASPEEGIQNFVNHVTKHYPEGVVLIAHNGFRFDFPLLQRDLKNYDLVDDLKSRYRVELQDSLDIFRKHFPRLQKYNQPYLVERFLVSDNVSDAHEAIGDCTNLKNAIEAAAKEKDMSVSEFLQLPGRNITTLF